MNNMIMRDERRWNQHYKERCNDHAAADSKQPCQKTGTTAQ